MNVGEAMVESRHQFKNGEFTVLMSVEDGNVLSLNIEDEKAGDQWMGRYNSSYIEELTHKTGNFKEFNIFCNMLESGLKKTSESIMLELMAYSDLESLRNVKSGVKQKKASNTKFCNRRYLIMTYTVEFDRIHYPLSLNYVGKVNVSSLKKLIKKQRDEITELKLKLQSALSSSQRQDQQDSSIEKLLREKEALFLELEASKQTLSNRDVARELRVLKEVVHSLENDLVKEKSRSQRLILRKSSECKQLSEELEAVKSSERNLRVRVKNLTEEISILKQNAHVSPSARFYSNVWLKKQKRSSNMTRQRDSKDRLYITPSPTGGKRFDPTAYVEEKRKRQQAMENSKQKSRPSSSVPRLSRRSRSRSLDRHTPVNVSQDRNRSAGLESRRVPSRGASRRTRNSSLSSIGSHHTSAESGLERSMSRKSSRNRRSVDRESSASRIQSGKRMSRSGAHSLLSSEDSDLEKKATIVKGKSKIKRASNERQAFIKNDEIKIKDSLDIAEIDARLNALQKFMNSNVDCI